MRIAIWGAGGFAREVRWLVEDLADAGADYDFAGFVVSDMGSLGDRDSREEVVGDIDWLIDAEHIDAVAVGIGSAQLRRKLGSGLAERAPRLAWPSLVHPSARFDVSSCSIADGVILCAGVIATVNVTFERFSMANLSCTIGHEAVVGEGSVLLPTVNVSGGAHIGSDVLVGTGAQILEYTSIGDGATVGAGAVVTRDVPAGETVVGVPAKPLHRSGA